MKVWKLRKHLRNFLDDWFDIQRSVGELYINFITDIYVFKIVGNKKNQQTILNRNKTAAIQYEN